MKDAYGNRHAVTNRNIDGLKSVYRKDELNITRMKGHRILDAGCGSGFWVEHLRRHDVEAYGVDIYLDESQARSSHFKHADMQHTGFPDQFFSEVFTTASLFTSPYDPSLKEQALLELARIVKVGGRIHLGDAYDVYEIEAIVSKVPGLRILDHYPGLIGESVEISRTR